MKTHMAGVALVGLLLAGCAGGSPRFTDRPEDEPRTGPVEQEADLEGQLLVAPPDRGAEQAIAEGADKIVSLAGTGGAAPLPEEPPVLPPAPDTSAVRPIIPTGGPRREYQVQVAITPSLTEAEELKERLTPLLEGEEVFIMFTRPYYRVRVGHKSVREEADVLLARLQELGYARAMVLPVTINPGEGR
jgi:hypothetical protein